MQQSKRYVGILLTLVVVLIVESARLSNTPIPIPFLLVYTTLILSANLGGIASGMASALIATLFIIYSSVIGFGPPTLTGGPVQVLFGATLFFASAWILGRTTAQNRMLVDELRDQESRLQEQVQERTASLERSHMRERESEERLRQSQKMDAVGQLTGGIAHDFNNMLSVVLGHAEMIRTQDGLDSVTVDHIDEIIAASGRAGSLISRLLIFSRQQNLSPSTLDVQRLLDDSGQLFKRVLGENITTTVMVDRSVWPILADRGEFDNTVLNLAINARDAMPDGGRLIIDAKNVSVDASQENILPELPVGDYVAISIIDTGSGIDAQIIDSIFDPFFTTKPEGKGTGLGLSMAYSFAKKSNGTLAVESKQKLGTTFTLYMPRSAQGLGNEIDKSTKSKRRGDGEIILVVEDNEDVRKVCVQLLAAGGYETVAVENGPKAMDYLSSGNHVDLLFTDIVMPGGMTGVELVESALGINPELAVLFTSGYSDESVASMRALVGNIQPVLAKPYSTEQLLRRVGRALANSPVL